MNFRKLTLKKISSQTDFNSRNKNVNDSLFKSSGKLTNLVKQELEPEKESFKEKFLQLSPGPKREKLILDQIIKEKPIPELVPVTVPGPANTKITYYVMPDYITLDGIRVPMAGKTAQKVADYFNMNLPTSKMSRQIWEAADTKVRPTPLSSSGYQGKNKYYSPQDVVNTQISSSEAAAAYSQKIEEAMQEKGQGKLKAGHMKDVISPEGDPNKLGLYGWYGEDGDPLEPSIQTAHDTSVHSEYGAGTRLVDNKVTVELPSGKKVKTTLKELLEHPEFYKTVSNVKGVKKYL